MIFSDPRVSLVNSLQQNDEFPHWSELSVSRVTVSDLGVFVCQANNSQGSGEALIEVTIKSETHLISF